MKKNIVTLAIVASLMGGCSSYNYGYDTSKIQNMGWTSTANSDIHDRLVFESEYNDRVRYAFQKMGMPDIYTTTGDYNYYGYYEEGKVLVGVNYSEEFGEHDYKDYIKNFPVSVYNNFAKYDESLNNANTTKHFLYWTNDIFEVVTVSKNKKVITSRGDFGSVYAFKRDSSLDLEGCHGYAHSPTFYAMVCEDKSLYLSNNGTVINSGTTDFVIDVEPKTKLSTQQSDYANFFEKCATKEELQKVYRRAYYTELSASGAAKAQEKGEQAVERAKAACQDEAALQMSLGEL